MAAVRVCLPATYLTQPHGVGAIRYASLRDAFFASPVPPTQAFLRPQQAQLLSLAGCSRKFHILLFRDYANAFPQRLTMCLYKMHECCPNNGAWSRGSRLASRENAAYNFSFHDLTTRWQAHCFLAIDDLPWERVVQPRRLCSTPMYISVSP